MFAQCPNPCITDYKLPNGHIIGITETTNGDVYLVTENALVYKMNVKGEILEKYSFLENVKILSFCEYEDQIWITTSDKKIYIASLDFEIQNSFELDKPAVSVAPLFDRSGVIISYFDDSNNESSFEYRSFSNLEIKATGFYGPKNCIISSVAFYHEGELYLACCSKKELCLLKKKKREMVLIQEHSEDSGYGDLTFSQMITVAERFLVDNMTGTIKTELTPQKYMERVCFFRNSEAIHGAIAKKDNWVAFLNPNELKLIDYNTKRSYKFEAKYHEPAFVKILKNFVICAYTDTVLFYDFRSQSMRFIMD